ncbi:MULTISPECIES: hypothetical protein [unclassified Variovorax]|uniref:hypothetical protein n=1 Tax=unclassified Variovorax TaxID=663243 RepID=UPI003F47A157
MSNPARSWGEVSTEPLTLEAIQRLYADSSKFRVSRNAYEVGARFSGSHKAGRVYVLSGAFRLQQCGFATELHAEMFCDFPAGAFEFIVTGDEPVELVNVWKFTFDDTGKLIGTDSLGD